MANATVSTPPIALDLIARQYLGKLATYKKVALLFGESPSSWLRWLSHEKTIDANQIKKWLDHWNQQSLPPLQLKTGKTMAELQLTRKEDVYVVAIGSIPRPTPIITEEADPELVVKKPEIAKTTLATPTTQEKKKLFVVPEWTEDLEWLGKGHLREVFRYNEELVVKIPLSEGGVSANRNEAVMWATAVAQAAKKGFEPETVNMARCKIGKVDEEEVLFMEFVRKSHRDHAKHKKHLRHVDRGQLGYTSDGRLVRFDYGG